jgi:hypothetical protein
MESLDWLFTDPDDERKRLISPKEIHLTVGFGRAYARQNECGAAPWPQTEQLENAPFCIQLRAQLYLRGFWNRM